MIEAIRNQALAIAGMAIIALLLIAVYFAWPFLPLGVASGAIWWFTRKRDNPWSRATADVMLPATAALVLLSLCVAGLRLFQPTDPTAELRAIETDLIVLRLCLGSVLSWPALASALIGLVLLNRFVKGGMLITKFRFVRRIVTAVFVALTTITTFTFFGSVPIDKLAASKHENRIARSTDNVRDYAALLRKHEDEVAEYLAAKTVERGLLSLQEPEKTMLASWLRSISDAALLSACPPPNEILSVRQKSQLSCQKGSVAADPIVVVRMMTGTLTATSVAELGVGTKGISTSGDLEAKTWAEQVARVRLKPEEILEAPTTVQAWTQQKELLDQQTKELSRKSSQVEEQGKVSSEAMTALVTLASESVGLATPELQGLVKEYFNALTSSLTEDIFRRVVRQWVHNDGDVEGTRAGVDLLANDSMPNAEVTKRLLLNQDRQSIELIEVREEIAREVRASAEMRRANNAPTYQTEADHKIWRDGDAISRLRERKETLPRIEVKPQYRAIP